MKYKLPEKKIEDRSEPKRGTREDAIVGVPRALGQGLTFGFADEIEAIIRSGLDKNKSYEDIVTEIRADIDKFRETSPVLAYGSEIAGSLPSALLGGAGIAKAGATAAKAGLTGAAKLGKGVGTQSAIQGAVYGAGASEEGERLGGAALGGAVGGAVGKAGDVILPKVGSAAKEYVKKFTPEAKTVGQKIAKTLGLTKPPLTIGQKYAGGDAGLFGNLINTIEEAGTGIPGVGSAIQTARLNNLINYNKYMLNDALKPLGIKVPASYEGREAFKFADDAVSNAYEKLLPKITLKDTDLLFNDITNIINKSDLGSDGLNKVYSFVSKNILDKIDNNTLSGDKIKIIESTLGKEKNKFIRKGGFEGDIGEVFQEIQDALRNQIDLQNKNLTELQAVNKTFYNMKRIGDAVVKGAQTEGIYTPSQLLSTIKKQDISIGKKQFARGDLPMQSKTELAEKTLGGKFPESGTASRIIAGNLATDLMKLPTYAIPGAAAYLGYSKPGTAVLSGLLNLPGRVVKGATPTTSGLLAPSLYNQYFGGQ